MLALRVITAFAAFFLTGCDKNKEFETVKSEVAAYKVEIERLNSEVSATKARVAALEEKQVIAAQVAPPAPPPRQTPKGPTQEQIAQLNRVIRMCVEVVHATKPAANDPLGEITAQFYARFDAYYNANTGRVQNNTTLNGELPAVYTFNKCMADNGIPLS
jgi:outer membrane murein-binding lipoprotein Lpp